MNERLWNWLSDYFPHWSEDDWDRLFGYQHAFEEPFTLVILSILGVAGRHALVDPVRAARTFLLGTDPEG